MKRIALFVAIAVSTATQVSAQCTANPAFINAPAGVYPRPDTILASTGQLSGNPNLGLNCCPATPGQPYEFTFTTVIDPNTPISAGAITGYINKVKVNSVTASTYDAGGNVVTTATSFSYDCGAPLCEYTPANSGPSSPGCFKYKSANVTEPVGDYYITIQAAADLALAAGGPSVISGFPVTFGGSPTQQTLIPGKYVLKVTTSTSLETSSANALDVAVAPNPTQGLTNFLLSAEKDGEYQFRLFDAMGRELHQQRIQTNAAVNNMPFDASQLPNGVYLYTFSTGTQTISGRLMVAR